MELSMRARLLNDILYRAGPVLYWMDRDQRADDNWALFFARDLAIQHRVPLIVAFNLVPNFLGGGGRQHEFKVRGLEEVAGRLAQLSIPFFLLCDESGRDSSSLLADFVTKKRVGAIVTDFFPLRGPREWIENVRRAVDVPLYGVDAHNIVPCWIASGKQEFGAYTLRPKLHKLLPSFLVEFPRMSAHPHPYDGEVPTIDWRSILALRIRESDELLEFTPGAEAAKEALEVFLGERLPSYADARNDPTLRGQSDLSPYLHYGQLSAQRVALEVVRSAGKPIAELTSSARNNAKIAKDFRPALRDHAAAFLEELIVRRELSDNFCFYNPDYDNTNGFPEWAKRTHEEHRNDPREYVYSLDEFAEGKTHDELWNAAQNELRRRGKMHGYLRMYWAKKILEWTASPEEAMKIAIALNDRYELDGRDPNGYAGIAWSIGGVHDRAWFDRPIYGKIRYMNRNGCATKFDVDTYISTWR